MKAAQGDEGAIAHLATTIPQSVFLFDAFLVLSNGRVANAPILPSEIAAYANFIGINSSTQKQRLIRAVYALDLVFRETRRGNTHS